MGDFGMAVGLLSCRGRIGRLGPQQFVRFSNVCYIRCRSLGYLSRLLCPFSGRPSPAGSGHMSSHVLTCKSAEERTAASSNNAQTEEIETSKALTRRIVSCESTRCVLDVLEAHSGNFRHLSTALFHIAKLAKGDTSSTHQMQNDSRFDWLMQNIVEDRSKMWPSISVSNLLQVCTMIHHDGLCELQSRAEEELCLQGRLFDKRCLISALHALAKLERSPLANSFIQNVENSLLRQKDISKTDSSMDIPRTVENFSLGMFTSEELGPLAYALSELHCSAQLADVIFETACARGGLESLPPKSLAMIARMSAERGSVENARSTVHALSAVIASNWALPTSSAAPFSDYDTVMLFFAFSRITRKISDETYRSDSSAVPKWTTAILDLLEHEPVIAQAADALMENILPRVPRIGQEGLTSVVFGLALLQRYNKELLHKLERRALVLMPSFDFSRIPRVCWSFAHLRYDSEMLMESCARAMVAKLPCATSNRDINCLNRSESYLGLTLVTALQAYAVLDRFQGPAAARLLSVLVERVGQELSSMNPWLIATVGWSLIVAKGPPGTLPDEKNLLDVMRVWRRAVAEHAPRIPPGALPMLHHVEVALTVECSTLGMDAPADYIAFFQSLYSSGRILAEASEAWDFQISTGIQKPFPNPLKRSVFQKSVHAALEALVPAASWVCEYWDPSLSYPLDVALPSLKIGIEADGPTHYTMNTRRALGATALKHRLIPQLGWTLVHIPFFEWRPAKGKQHGAEYLRKKLEEAGVDVERLISGRSDDERIVAADKNAGLTPSILPAPSEVTADPETLTKHNDRLRVVQLKQGKMSRVDLLKHHVARRANSSSNNSGIQPRIETRGTVEE